MPARQTTLREILHDPGIDVAHARAEATGIETATIVRPRRGAVVRVGTASWTDPTMTARGVFYPPTVTTAEDRLRYYASRFPTVEVDSTYYAIPERRTTARWLRRTPDDFLFTVKAFGLLTGHPAEVERLPPRVRRRLPRDLAGKPRVYAKHLSPSLQNLVWEVFLSGLEPLRSSGKLACVLLQYPKWFMPNPESKDALLEASERLGDIPGAVEFRNRRWFTERGTERTLRFLTDHEIPFVMVDEPQGFESSVPPIAAVTSPRLAMLRLHGRRADRWEKPGIKPSERFRYLYDKDELEPWVEETIKHAQKVREMFVLQNNCHGNYGTTNALEFTRLLRDKVEGAPPARPRTRAQSRRRVVAPA